MTPETEARLLVVLSRLESGNTTRSGQMTELISSFKSHEVKDEERHQQICKRLDRLEGKTSELSEDVNEVTGRHDVQEKVRAEIARMSITNEVTRKEEHSQARDWIKFMGTPLLAVFGTILALVIARLFGLR